MALSTDFLIVHSGKHHALHLVAGCLKSGSSVLFATPFYKCGLGSIVAGVPGKIGRKASGYFHKEIRRDCVMSPGWWQLRKVFSFVSGKSLDRTFDQYMAKQLRDRHLKPKVLVALQDYMPRTIEAAHEMGALIWSDQISNQSNNARTRINRHAFELNCDSGITHTEEENDRILARASIVTVPSDYCWKGIKDRICENVILCKIPYGCDAVANTGVNRQDGCIVVVARANSLRKGGHLLLRALSQCGDRIANLAGNKKVEFVFLGDFSSELLPIVRDLRLPEQISVRAGSIPHSEVPKLLSKSSMFVMPALSEGMSLACLEAMGARLPLMITDFCGIDGLEDGNIGLKVEDTAESVESALIFAFENQDRWSEWGQFAGDTAALLGWETYEARVAALCRDIRERANCA